MSQNASITYQCIPCRQQLAQYLLQHGVYSRGHHIIWKISKLYGWKPCLAVILCITARGHGRTMAGTPPAVICPSQWVR